RGTIQKRFKKALKKDAPAPENYIYVNKKYRNKALGDLYARTIGLQDIIEAPIGLFHLTQKICPAFAMLKGR
ncbi:hypothetical protein B0H10DRAFT_2327732, partial [Mycena sp. CBHHK59/15]